MATTTNNGWETPDDTDLVKDGALAIRTLGEEIDTSVGEGLLAWQSWAPTLGTGWANGNGTWNAKYCQIGKTVHFWAEFVLGSTTTKGSTMTISLPVTAANAKSAEGSTHSILTDGAVRYLGVVIGSTTTAINLGTSVANATYTTWNAMSATTPFTWATGDSLTIGGTYEAA